MRATSPLTSLWSTKRKGHKFWSRSSASLFPEKHSIHTFTCMLVHACACSCSLARSPVRMHTDASLHSLTRLPEAHLLIHTDSCCLTPMLTGTHSRSLGHRAAPPCTHMTFPPPFEIFLARTTNYSFFGYIFCIFNYKFC